MTKRDRFFTSRQFAAMLIGLFFGIAFGEFVYICMLPRSVVLTLGAGMGYAAYNLYLGIMRDIREDAERRRTWDIKGTARRA